MADIGSSAIRNGSVDLSHDDIELRQRRQSKTTFIEDVQSDDGSFYEKDATFIRVTGREDYAPIDKYEGRHHYDPDFKWTAEEESKVVRKIDLRICSWVCFTFFALQLDRANIIQAVSDNMIGDLHMNTNEYNYGNMIFFICFLFAELPSQLISKKVGPDNWIPIQMISWSLVSSCQAFLTDKNSYFITRALLGLIEGGFIPDTILYLSYWYKSKELPKRLAYFWASAEATLIVGAFMAAGLISLRGRNGLEGWRWMFAIEGLLTGCIGIATFFYMPPSPTQTASFFRGRNGWFNEREEKIMVNRVLRDDPSKGDMHNRQAISMNSLWQAISDWEMWPIYLIGLSFFVPVQPTMQYMTLILRQSFSKSEVNLLTIPAYVLFVINLLWVTWLSEKLNQRFLTSLIGQLWPLPLLIANEFITIHVNKWVRFTLVTLLVGTPYTHVINVALTSRNSGSVRTRTVASAMYNMFVQASSVYSTNIYRSSDRPLYRTGNKALLGILAWNVVLLVMTKLFYIWRNKYVIFVRKKILILIDFRVRESKWNAMNADQQLHYLRTTTDKGNKMLTFRFAS